MILNIKFFNYRPFVFGLLGFVLGSFLAVLFFINIWFLVAFCFLVILFIIIFYLQKWYIFIFKNLIKCLIIVFFVVLGMISFSVSEFVYQKNILEEGVYSFKARVVSVYETDLNSIENEYVIDNIIVSSDNKIQSLSGKVKIKSTEDLELGDTIIFDAKFSPIRHFPFDVKSFGSEYCGYMNIYSSIYVYGNNYSDLNIFDKFKNVVWSKLEQSVDREQAGVLFGMVFGDKSKIIESTQDSYRASGIAHILAVSGLHVGFLVVILAGILNFLRLNKRWSFLVISVVLLVYCWLCGFTYSVLRASLMCVVALYAGLRGKQYDGLSALCFSSIIILTINAFELFSVSFLLSFFSVFSLFCLQKMFEQNMERLYPHKFAKVLSVSLSASIGTFPWLIYYFGNFPVLSVFINILLIPFASFAYTFAFIFIPIVLVVGVFDFLLIIPSYLLKFIDIITIEYAKLPFAVINLNVSLLFVVFWIFAIICASDYLLIKKRKKLILVLCSMGMCFGVLLLNLFKVI